MGAQGWENRNLPGAGKQEGSSKDLDLWNVKKVILIFEFELQTCEY